MKITHEGETHSPWLDQKELNIFLPLTSNEETDVCVIGGGLTGLSVAYQLIKKGKTVIVLEAEGLEHGESNKSTAHCTTALDTRYFQLIKDHGQEAIRLVANSHEEGINKLIEIIYVENIDCDLEKLDGNLFYAKEENANKQNQIDEKENQNHFLNKELEAALASGLSDVFISTHQRILFNMNYNFKTPSLCFPNQYQINPLKLINGLAKVILKLGGKIYTNSRAISVNSKDHNGVKTENGYSVKCQYTVVATNSPINEALAIHTKISSHRSYVIGLEIPLGSMKPFLFWDTESPYHYARLEKKDYRPYDLILIGGEDHKTGQDDKDHKSEFHFQKLEEWGRKTFQSIGSLRHKWSGQIIEPLDGLAYIGRSSQDLNNVFIATGFGGNGITYAMISGILLSDLICHKFNSWEAVYSPSRIKLSSTTDYIKQNLNVLGQYTDWLLDNSKIDLSLVLKNEGAVFRDGINLCALYKDNDNHLEIFSAACPHLGGIIHWNTVEKSWDCPCHGSRFDCHGKVINGPAVVNLKPYLQKNHPINPPLVSELVINQESNNI